MDPRFSSSLRLSVFLRDFALILPAASRLCRATAWQAMRRPPEELIDLRVQPIRVNLRLFAVRILQPT